MLPPPPARRSVAAHESSSVGATPGCSCRRRARVAAFLLVPFLACCAAADSSEVAASRSDVGAPCIPHDEDYGDFSDHGDGVNLYWGEPCESGLCLAYDFLGRVSCPYGQTQQEVETLPADAPARCRTPRTGEPVTVPVQPQSVDRPPELAVICSCRCDGPESETDYCACPSGMECRHLVDDVGQAASDFAGSYCVPQGYNPGDDVPPGPLCDKESLDPATDCGNDRENP